ncbi:phosphotransferase [Oceanimonas sp. CHS3-5]|uniref:phosphotransferase n=1 Tax=Oceanimonas sp. CHS3-5 TaxID=3068186 RepID=UPI00273ED1A0|nr:phosphotransferase [Oceanimonas sp. CHS3-5]MDP5291336.1 phosphotransferase [Oceanimonas sp. CHS3-5]
MDAEPLLASLPPALRGRLTPLAGGYTNRCFRLNTETQSYWLRLGCEAPASLGIDRHLELMAHGLAAEAGLAPAIRYADAGSGLLVLDWLNEPDWRQAPGTLAALMPKVAQLHGLKVPDLPLLSLTQRVQHYLDQLHSLPAWLAPLLAAFERPALNPTFVPALCHCDLTAGNVLGPRPWLLDWEYAALADPAFELAVIADDRGLNDAGCNELLAHYRAAGGEMSAARLRARLPWVQLLTLLWAMVQHQHSGKAEYKDWLEAARALLTKSLG